MPLKFGVHIPTCIEGMMYPVPFARPSDILPTAVLCERLGYDSVWGNDHMTTQRYVQREFPQPPNFYEPLITFSYVAARTTKLRIATGIIVLPMRGIPVLAKQVATLDQLSGGRVILGVGTGAYREEYEALFPDAKNVHRGTIVDEGMRALRLLFTERRATFHGTYVHFEEIECFPKPAQNPLPLYAGGNHPEVRRRAGEYAEGWMPAVLSPEEIKRGIEDIHRYAAKAGRDGAKIDVAPQFAVSIGRTHEDAVKRFHASQLYRHLESLKNATLREQTGGFEQRNLIGSPEEICERIRIYVEAGVTTLSGMLFVASSVPEMQEAIELFALSGRETMEAAARPELPHHSGAGSPTCVGDRQRLRLRRPARDASMRGAISEGDRAQPRRTPSTAVKRPSRSPTPLSRSTPPRPAGGKRAAPTQPGGSNQRKLTAPVWPLVQR